MEFSIEQIQPAIEYAKEHYPHLLLDKFNKQKQEIEEHLRVFIGLSITELIELREYCGGQISYLGDLYARYKQAEDQYNAEYKAENASIKANAMNDGDSAAKATIKADLQEATLKALVIKTEGTRQKIKSLLNFVEKRDDAIKQYISYLKQELNKNQFIGNE